jgi:hypothetical protein
MEMKRLIRWLSDISGVTFDIQIEQMKDCGYRMHDAHYWFNGGVPGAWMVCNAFRLWANDLREGKYPRVDSIRTKVYEVGDKHIENI